MLQIIIMIIIVLIFSLSHLVHAQAPDHRAQDLAAALDKTTYKKKNKIDLELYIEIKNVPAVRDNVEYSGTYRSEEYGLDLKVSPDGTASGSGYDVVDYKNSQQKRFTVKDARVEGALLTGTKVYENG